MALRDAVYDGILAKLPEDPAVRDRYFELVDIWEEMAVVPNAGRDFSKGSFEKLKSKVRPILTVREMDFFAEPFSEDVVSHPALFQAKITARLSKILMDRQGYKVSKTDGGLG